jgi:hypothetical protein
MAYLPVDIPVSTVIMYGIVGWPLVAANAGADIDNVAGLAGGALVVAYIWGNPLNVGFDPIQLGLMYLTFGSAYTAAGLLSMKIRQKV